MSAAPFDAILVDLDGTLTETLGLSIALFGDVLEELDGRRPTRAEVDAQLGASEDGMLIRLGARDPQAALRRWLELYAERLPRDGTVWREIVDALAVVRRSGRRVALITGKSAASTAITLREFGMEAAFDAVETGDPNGVVKGRQIRDLLDRFAIPAARAVYVGDAPSDVRSAREAGVAAWGAGWAATTDRDALAAAGPDRLFTTADEFVAALTGAGG